MSDTACAQVVVRDVQHRYRQGAFELGPLSMTLDAGVTCVLGANGAGKSTLFRIIAGIDTPLGGTVVVKSSNPHPAIGYLPQTFVAPDRARCVDYLRYVAWLQGVPSSLREARISHVLELVGLSDKKGSPVRQLSGGMRRRLGIAQAVIHEPGLILLDEPTAGLDLEQRVRVCQTVRAVAENAVVVVSTHILDDVTRMSDYVVTLDSGQLKFAGTRAELRERPLRDDGSKGGTDLAMLRSLEDLLHQENGEDQ